MENKSFFDIKLLQQNFEKRGFFVKKINDFLLEVDLSKKTSKRNYFFTVYVVVPIFREELLKEALDLFSIINSFPTFNNYINLSIYFLNQLIRRKYLTLNSYLSFIPKSSEAFKIEELEGEYKEEFLKETYEKGNNDKIWINAGKIPELFGKKHSNHALCITDPQELKTIDFLFQLKIINQILEHLNIKTHPILESFASLLLTEYIEQYIYWRENGEWLYATNLNSEIMNKKDYEIQKEHWLQEI